MRGRKLVGRITAAVLAACMVAALFPAAAFADAAQSNTADIDNDKGLHEDGSLAISKANFPDDNFRKYLLEIFDAAESATTAGNGQTYIFKADKAGDKCLTKNELESKITHIYCSGWGIESLEGIQYFKALNWLDCENNKLTNAEMSAVTSNEQLQKTLRGLQCAGNLITELDVSGCHNLETLGCIGGKAKLTTLKVNPELHVLYCYNNNIGALDVSACTQLIELNCDYNPRIGALDVSNSPDLLYLFCQKTGLTQLDVSHNSKLRTLRCNYNDLQTLDVTKNTALRRLFCTDIGITSLDLTQNSDLTMLNVSDNQLTSLALINGQFSLSDPDDPELVPQFTCSGNKYQIVVGTARTFDLKTLPGGFEAGNVTIRSGGTVDAETGILTVDPNVDKVTYTYNCGVGQSAEFTLLVHTHHFGGWMYDDETWHKHLCKDDGDVEYEEHTYDETGTTCTKCGYQQGHTWEWAYDGTGHWLVSTTDGTRTDTVSHEFSVKLAEEKGKADQLVCACGYTIDGVAINQKNFPDDNFRNYISAQFDTENPKFATVTPGDHFITSGELAGIVAIDCSSLGIKSLEGIELFTALTSLKCNDNDLAASGLDVSALQNLKVLHAQNCGLTELDLSQNKQLQDLGVNSNGLTELDLSSCKEMLYLWAQHNQLTNLNLTDLSKIQDVAVNDNKLTELDLSDKTQLNKVCIQNNNLTNLTLGGTLYETLKQWEDGGNEYTIIADENRQFDLSKLPGEFEVDKADNWEGGKVDKETGILTVDENAAVVTYTYQYIANKTTPFKLNVIVHKHQYADDDWQPDTTDTTKHWHCCIDPACPDVDKGVVRQDHDFVDGKCDICGYDPSLPVEEPEASFQPGRDIGGALATAIVAGTAAWGSYEVATRLILHSTLPKGAEIPTARIQLASLLWESAGKPEPAAPPAFADVADPDEAKAAQWCVEQGLLDETSEGRFDPYGWMPKYKTIQVWNTAKEKGLLS